jgi:hypothetical protein
MKISFLLVSIIIFIFAIIAFLFNNNFGIYSITHLILSLMFFILFLRKKDRTFQIDRLISSQNLKQIFFFLIILLLIIFANLLAFDSSWRVDFTEQKIFSLSNESINVLKSLEKTTKITVQAPLKPEHRQNLIDLLEQIKKQKPALINYLVFDSQSHPEEINRIKLGKGENVFIEYGDSSTKLSSPSESQIVSALNKLQKDKIDTFYYITGHGEPSLNEIGPNGFYKFKEAIEVGGKKIKNLVLAENRHIPIDTKALLITAPESSYTPEEIKAIDDYLYDGGKALFFLEPNSFQFSVLLEKRGIKSVPAIMVDRMQKIFGSNENSFQIVTKSFGAHISLKTLRDTDLTSFYYTLPLVLDNDFVKNKLLTALVLAPKTSWGETSGIEDISSMTLDNNDFTDNLVLSVAFEGLPNKYQNKTRIVVFGDSSWVNNQNIDLFANRKLLEQVSGWLVGNISKIESSDKSYRKSVILLSNQELSSMFMFSLIIPELLLILAVYLWSRRNANS